MVENGNISIDSFVDFERCIADGHGLEHENMVRITNCGTILVSGIEPVLISWYIDR